jgi:hypothetical protein
VVALFKVLQPAPDICAWVVPEFSYYPLTSLKTKLHHNIDQEIQKALDILSRERLPAFALLHKQGQLFKPMVTATNGLVSHACVLF